jgi:hypothetical protein
VDTLGTSSTLLLKAFGTSFLKRFWYLFYLGPGVVALGTYSPRGGSLRGRSGNYESRTGLSV